MNISRKFVGIVLSIILVVWILNIFMFYRADIKKPLFLRHKIEKYGDGQFQLSFIKSKSDNSNIEYVEFPEIQSEKIHILSHRINEVEENEIITNEKSHATELIDNSNSKISLISLNFISDYIKTKDGKNLVDKASNKDVTLTKIKYKLDNSNEIYEENIGDVNICFCKEHTLDNSKEITQVDSNGEWIFLVSRDNAKLTEIESKSLNLAENIYGMVIDQEFLVEDVKPGTLREANDLSKNPKLRQYCKLSELPFPIKVEADKPLNIYVKGKNTELLSNDNYEYAELDLIMKYKDSKGSRGNIIIKLPVQRAIINDSLVSKLKNAKGK